LIASGTSLLKGCNRALFLRRISTALPASPESIPFPQKRVLGSLSLKNVWFLGVDLSWGFRRPSWVCVLEEKEGKTYWREFFFFVSLEEWERRLCSFPSCVVAFDAPLRVPVERGLRKAEKDLLPKLRKKHLGILPINREIVRKRYPALIPFWKSIEEHFSFTFPLSPRGRHALEVFPPLSVLGFFGEEGLKLYRERRLQELGEFFGKDTSPLRIENLKDCLSTCLSPKDRFDAFLCACTALFAAQYGEEALQKFGDHTSFIVLPLWSGEL